MPTAGLTMLHEITVVSLEQYISAPYCTQILADAGATVIKVERPGGGDPRRDYDPIREVGDDRVSGGFASYNRGKQSVALNISDEFDQVSLISLLQTADVLVSNLRPGALERAGFGAKSLRLRFPKLVICEITGFGTAGGPSESWPAFDSVIQAMSGMSSLIGESPDGPPGLAPMGTMDVLSGTWAAVGILLALIQRTSTGEGSYVDTAMLDVGAAFLERPLALLEFSGIVQTRGSDAFSPVGAFRAADGLWLSIVIPTDDMWSRCCDAMGRPDLVDQPGLDSVLGRADRMQNTIVPLLEEWAQREALNREQVAARMRAHGQPVGVINAIDGVRSDPQLGHRGLFAPLLARHGDSIRKTEFSLPTMPLLFDGVRAAPGPVPRLDEHDARIAEVLAGDEQPW